MVFEIIIHIYGRELEPFLVDEDCYSVVLLFKDAKMFATGEGLSYEESHILKGKVRLLYGSLFELRNDCDLLALFKLLKIKALINFMWILRFYH